MKIEEAIEILNTDDSILLEYLLGDRPEFVGAIKLGIEALKWIEWRRGNYKQPPILPLPGETK